MSGRMLWIELRRNELLLVFPVVILIYGFVAWETVLNQSVLFWTANSVWARNAIALLGPFAGVVAAWMAGRERRHGLDDLIATTPRPVLSRDLTGWAATTLLDIAAFAVLAAVILGRTASRASWDGPDLSLLVPGFCTIAAMAAIGYPIGRLSPRRTTAILVGAGLIAALSLPITITNSWPEYLSPVFQADASPWWGIQPDIARSQSIFFLGVACLGLAAIAVVSRARRLALPVLLVAIVSGAVGIGMIRSGVRAEGGFVIAAYEPVCAGDTVTVCVHPAFAGVLDDLVAGTETIFAPFVGLDGVPTRFEQQAPQPSDDIAGPFADVVDGSDSGDGGVYDRLAKSGFFIDAPVNAGGVIDALTQMTDDLLGMPKHPYQQGPPAGTAVAAHIIIQFGLLKAAGYDITCKNGLISYQTSNGLLSSTSSAISAGRAYSGDLCAEFDRFVTLAPDVRNTWLRQHYAAIRAGEITVEDLP